MYYSDAAKECLETRETNNVLRHRKTFSFDEDGEILCDCTIGQTEDEISRFADMLYQVFSGKLTTATLLFIYQNLEKDGREDVRQVLQETLTSIISGDMENIKRKEQPDSPVVKPTEVISKLNSKRQ